MVNSKRLVGLIAEEGMSKSKFAKKADMTLSTLNRKLKAGVFNTNEIEKIAEVLNIQNPAEIFFAKDVT